MKIENFVDKMHRLYSETEEFKPTTITFQVCDYCNLKCSYCYEVNKQNNSMPFEVAKTFIDELLENSPKTISYVNSYDRTSVVLEFIGGEPFLKIDLIDEITDYFISKAIELHHPWALRYMISITSNGTLYFDPKVQEYIKKNRRNLSLSISVDGNKQLHDMCRVDANGNGSYDKAIAAVKHYMEYWHGNMGTKLTLAPANIEYAYDALKDLYTFGYDDAHFNCAFEEGWTPEHAKIYYEQMKRFSDWMIENDMVEKYHPFEFNPEFGHPTDPENTKNWCGSTKYMLALDWRGDIYPCIRFMDSSLGNKQIPYCIGNIYDGIEYDDCTRCRVDCLNKVTRKTSSTDECFNCPISTGCANCNGYAYEVNGTPNSRTTYHCIMVKARSLFNCYLWNTYYRKKGISKRYKLDCPKEWALEIIDESEYNMLLSLSKE